MSAAGPREEIVELRSGKHPIFGILHHPASPARGVGIVVVNSRVEYRLGPQRLFVEAARRWARAGFHVLRIDHPGNGDSPGDDRYPHMDSFPLQPPIDAVRFLIERTNVECPVLLGNCMGARNALFASARCPEVDHVICLGMPFSNATPFYASEQSFSTQRISPTVARSTVKGYLQRAASPTAWKRLLTGDTEYRVLGRALRAALGLGGPRLVEEPTFRSMKDFFGRGGRALFLFGTNDVFLPDFRDESRRAARDLPELETQAEVEFVEGANHTFSRVHWRRGAIERVSAWLEREFPAAPAEVA